MATEAQIAANKANAQKSTGPKTPEGKAISRKNSLKHGLTGIGEVLTPEASALAEKLTAAFLESLLPQNDAEAALATLAATCTARLQTYNLACLADIDAARINIPFTREAKRRDEIETALNGLCDNPRPHFLTLSQSTDGLDWLLEQWSRLRTVAENPNTFWTYRHLTRALAILDVRIDTVLPDPTILALARLVLAAQPAKSRDSALVAIVRPGIIMSLDPQTWLDGITPPLPPAADAREALIDLANDQIEALEDRRAQVAAIEQATDALAPMRIDPTTFPNAVLHLRYESTLTRQLNAALLRLEKLRTTTPRTSTPPAPQENASPSSPARATTPSPTPAEPREPTAASPASTEHRAPTATSPIPPAEPREPIAECPQQFEPNFPAPTPTPFLSPTPIHSPHHPAPTP